MTPDAPAPAPLTPGPRGPAEPEGGDPACWLQQVCPACGRMAEEDPPTRCAACGEPLPAE